ncbi:MAG: hypothetical protein ACLT3Y_06945 [Ruminococcus callidus]
MNFLKFLKRYPLIMAFVVSIAVANIWDLVQNAKKSRILPQRWRKPQHSRQKRPLQPVSPWSRKPQRLPLYSRRWTIPILAMPSLSATPGQKVWRCTAA